MEVVDPYGWNKISSEKAEEIRSKLCDFESMTLAEIFVQAKHLNHGVPAHKLDKSACERLEQLGLSDEERVWCLRLSGQERVWGILHQNIVNLLWYDPEHQVYPTKLRHT